MNENDSASRTSTVNRIHRPVLALLIGSITFWLAIAFIYSHGKLSAQSLGFMVFAFMGCVLAVLVVRSWRARSKLDENAMKNTSTLSSSALRRIRWAIAALAALLVFGLWRTSGEPLAPRLVGALVNLSVIALLGRILYRANRDKTPPEIADLIERFLDGKSLYPQEWNDFVDSSQRSKKLDVYRKRCEELDPLVNRPGDPDAAAVQELRNIVEILRRSREGGWAENP